MKRNIILSAATLAAVSLVGIAQTNKPADTTKPAQTADTKPMAGKLAVEACRDLLGSEVRNTTGEKLGKVEDLVLYPDGNVAYAVLSYGGILGMGDKLFALPWCLIQTGAVAEKGKHERIDHVVVAVDKERLKAAPGFDKDKWPKEANVAMFGDCDRYYATEMTTLGRPMEASARNTTAGILRASDLKGANVETPTAEKLGDIKEVVIDPRNGRVNYVVLSVGGFLGVGDRLVAVPWSAIKVTREGEKSKFALPITKEKLEKAPEFYHDDARWMEMSDPVYIGRVYTYYSVRPYWSDAMVDKNPSDQGGKDKGKDPLKKD